MLFPYCLDFLKMDLPAVINYVILNPIELLNNKITTQNQLDLG